MRDFLFALYDRFPVCFIAHLVGGAAMLSGFYALAALKLC